MTIKKFIGHISTAIAVSNRSRAQSDQIGVGIAFDNPFNTTGPLRCPRMMELIENNRIGMDIKMFLNSCFGSSRLMEASCSCSI